MPATISAAPAAAWVVLKFGGTSVSSLSNWRNIAAVVRARRALGSRVLVVHSAVSGITDRLEKLLAAALGGAHEPVLAAIEERHRQLVEELGIGASVALEQYFTTLRQTVSGIALMGEVSDRTRARVLAAGELMATEIGARYLQSQGIDARWWDARHGLRSEQRESASVRASYLAATCDFAHDTELQSELAAIGPVVITQGFIASDAAGDTVLLGRGGSDTSGAYLAAKLAAERLEIWTDVPGMFSANPRATPQARLLRALHYDEAQEIASSGAKVLHPRCILPARTQRIPIAVYATQCPDMDGTHISADGGDGAAQVKAVCIKKDITLVALDSPGMWHQVGFLADAFQVFKRHGLSIDLVSTSETNVTVSLDPQANSLDQGVLDALVSDLSKLCRVQVIGPCASVTLVGRNIRAILHRLGDAFELFSEQRIYLLSQAANDLNLTFVVDENQGDRLVQELHDRLIRPVREGAVLGPSWQQLFGGTASASATSVPGWWRQRRNDLLGRLGERDCAYVYDSATIRASIGALAALRSVDRLLYSMKANGNAAVLREIAAAGVGFECVSRGEIEQVLAAVPGLARERILFTPNFAPRHEYEWALTQGIPLTVDNLFVFESWGELLRGRRVFVRIDTGTGRGHHHHVRTAGAHTKFGIPIEQIGELVAVTQRHGITVCGLHAHAGSGILEAGSWAEVATLLLGLGQYLPALEVIDVGGGLGVADAPGGPALDLAALDTALLAARQRSPHVALWLEPGRFLVAAAGVLLARVTQTKSKDERQFVGVATGMNSLIRPALYGAWHEIVNLSRLDQPSTQTVDVVGPICESADVLGHDRPLPPTEPGDVLLIANAGAYGYAMSSHYNLRDPAPELML